MRRLTLEYIDEAQIAIVQALGSLPNYPMTPYQALEVRDYLADAMLALRTLRHMVTETVDIEG